MGVKVASFKKKDDTVNAIAVTGYQEEEEESSEAENPEVQEGNTEESKE